MYMSSSFCGENCFRVIRDLSDCISFPDERNESLFVNLNSYAVNSCAVTLLTVVTLLRCCAVTLLTVALLFESELELFSVSLLTCSL